MLLKFIAISSKSYRKVQDIFPSAGTKKNKKKLTLTHETKQRNRFSIPDPLILALGLTLVTMILALVFGTNMRSGILGAADVLSYWTSGVWHL
jgi:hypothetical protein